MSSVPFLECQNLAFSYGGRAILSDVNFTVEEGKFVAIMGSSGSGKTTLLRLITGQMRPTSGKILIKGRDISTFSQSEWYDYRSRMGVLFQHGALFTDLSVFDNVAFPMRELTKLPETVIHDLVKLKLNAVGLRGTENLMPAELSGGMARRVALARTIALDPEFLLYDEPFTGLDPISLGVICELIHRVNKALHSTSVMVTHDIAKSLMVVDQAIFLASGGKIAFSGSPAEMLETDSPLIQQFISGAATGPVAFRYPAQTHLEQDLFGKQAVSIPPPPVITQMRGDDV